MTQPVPPPISTPAGTKIRPATIATRNQYSCPAEKYLPDPGASGRPRGIPRRPAPRTKTPWYPGASGRGAVERPTLSVQRSPSWNRTSEGSSGSSHQPRVGGSGAGSARYFGAASWYDAPLGAISTGRPTRTVDEVSRRCTNAVHDTPSW